MFGEQADEDRSRSEMMETMIGGSHHLSRTETTQTLVPEREHNLPSLQRDYHKSLY
ncbi:hypothetical protein N665_0162s0040 [Sinapis alba]|nr:hypothetical protein N665_0162s0040 [Sinapis alba]